MHWLRGTVVVFLATLAPGLARASIEITIHVAGVISGPAGGRASDSFTGLAVTSPETLTASAGGSSSAAVLDWFTGGIPTTLALDFEHSRAGTSDSIAQTQQYLEFTAGATAPYSLSGVYNVAHPGESGAVWLEAYLFDVTGGLYLFNGQSESQNTTSEELALGMAGGDAWNYVEAGSSLTGTLLQGHSYQLYLHAYSENFVADDGATGSGSFTFTVGTAVPEPLSLAAWSGLTSVCGLVAYRRRRTGARAGSRPKAVSDRSATAV